MQALEAGRTSVKFCPLVIIRRLMSFLKLHSLICNKVYYYYSSRMIVRFQRANAYKGPQRVHRKQRSALTHIQSHHCLSVNTKMIKVIEFYCLITTLIISVA